MSTTTLELGEIKAAFYNWLQFTLTLRASNQNIVTAENVTGANMFTAFNT